MTDRNNNNHNIIALLTDFGNRDPFTGIMKGVIYSINPDAVITDLTNEIRPHNIFEGAFSLFESYKYFPAGTVFLCVVDPGVGGRRKSIIIESPDYFFVGPDNGLMSLPLKGNEKIFEISSREFMLRDISSTFHGRDVFAPAAAHISKGISPEEFGSSINFSDIRKIEIPPVEERKDCLSGSIIFSDKFGNLITNIENRLSGKIKSIEIKGTIINKISSAYKDGKPDQPIALKGSAGFIEIAVNSGSAEKTISADIGQRLIVRLS
ncbi:MAG: SAM-dependent chlorinase/fluorinase [Spirochaetes bacterium]|nr:SAM-dependent chlorinase/fluorinase [Spirochaetota bacterium]